VPTAQEPAPPITVAAAATPTASTPRPPVTVKPEKPVAHGGPARQFLNQNVTPHLLEGMKYLAVYEPEKPLLWLSEFLKDRSKEIEGS
jgi:COMPASS component SDC1